MPFGRSSRNSNEPTRRLARMEARGAMTLMEVTHEPESTLA
jgi:hypothetical protein